AGADDFDAPLRVGLQLCFESFGRRFGSFERSPRARQLKQVIKGREAEALSLLKLLAVKTIPVALDGGTNNRTVGVVGLHHNVTVRVAPANPANDLGE